jgi:hypothetical protein
MSSASPSQALRRKNEVQIARSPARWILPAIVTLLALADGALHFALDYVLFHGNLFGALHFGPPPGPAGAAPPPSPPPQSPILQSLDIARITGIPLNRLFVLNAIGYVVLAIAFLLAPRLLGRWSWIVDLALVVYAAASIVGWLDVGSPNPNGLGYLSKVLEVLLIATLLAHIWVTRRRRQPPRAQHRRQATA